MIDSTTHERLQVSIDGNAGPYVMVPLDQLKVVEKVLKDHHIVYWVDADAISIDGKPEIAIVNLGRDVDGKQIQQFLDSVK